MWNRDGSISIVAIERLLAQELSGLKLKTERIAPSDLWKYMNLYPVIIGYKETLMGHINVIYGNPGTGDINIMDPGFPIQPTRAIRSKAQAAPTTCTIPIRAATSLSTAPSRPARCRTTPRGS